MLAIVYNGKFQISKQPILKSHFAKASIVKRSLEYYLCVCVFTTSFCAKEKQANKVDKKAGYLKDFL